MTEALRGDMRRAESSARLAWQQAQQRGIAYEIAISESELGAVLLHVGEADQAREILQRAARVLSQKNYRREASLAQLRLVRAAFECERFRLAIATMRRVAETAVELGDDAALVAELARGRGFVRYMRDRKVGSAWRVPSTVCRQRARLDHRRSSWRGRRITGSTSSVSASSRRS